MTGRWECRLAPSACTIEVRSPGKEDFECDFVVDRVGMPVAMLSLTGSRTRLAKSMSVAVLAKSTMIRTSWDKPWSWRPGVRFHR